MVEQSKSSDKAGERVLDVSEQVGPIDSKEPAPSLNSGRPGMPRSVPKGFFDR